MGSILKLVYQDWLGDYPLPNGLTESLILELKEKFGQESPYRSDYHMFVQRFIDSRNAVFRGHNHVYLHCIKHHGSTCMIPLDQINEDQAVYLYPIEIRTELRSLYQLREQGYTLIDTLHPKLLEQVRSKKVKILINYLQDPITHLDDLLEFELYLINNFIDPSQVVIVGGNNYSDKYKEQFSQGKLQFSSGDLFLQEAAEKQSQYPRMGRLGYVSDIVREEDLNSAIKRPYKFLCFNRQTQHRHHRLILAYFGIKYNLFDSSIFSFIGKVDQQEVSKSLRLFLDESAEQVQQYSQKIFEMLPLEIDTQHLPVAEKTNFNSDNNNKKVFANSYIHLTSETRFTQGSGTFLSEKTFRPISNLQPFLYFGDAHSLRKLKDFGFKTFEPFIDESYDNELDPKKRMLMLEQQLIKLVDASIDEIHDWYYSIIDTLIYNQTHLLTFKNLDPFQQTIQMLERSK